MADDKHWRYLKSGEILFREGDVADHAYVIETGHLEISTGAGERRKVLATLGPGEVVGEMAVVDRRPRTATVVADSPSRLLVVSNEHLNSKLTSSDPLVRLLLQVILKRYRNIIDGDAGGFSMPEPDRAAALASIHLSGELEQALERSEFVLHYQPIVRLKDLAIIGYEALIRWNSPVRGMVGPDKFIPALEESGFILEVGRWVLRSACEALARFGAAPRAVSDVPLHMSVNLSGRQLATADLASEIQATVQAAGIAPAQIQIEVTESFLIDNMEAAVTFIERCRAAGFGVSVDDFGTGYSSLNYLRRFAIDTVKIDRSFVAPALRDKNSMKILRAIGDLARALELKMVVEGVEAIDQGRLMQQLGIECAQGYLFARPMPESAALKFQASAWPWEFERNAFIDG